MIKKNKLKMLISSVIILLPTAVGLILWHKFPDTLAVHWGIGGTVDSMGGKGYVVFFLPLILLVIHWLGMVITAFDPKNKNQTEKALNIVFWIMPCVSVFSMTVIYLTAFGIRENNIFPFLFIFMGLGMILIGNYLPKCRQNYTLGIKIKWTLQSKENWNVTHRLGGKVWLVCGVLIMITALLPYEFSMFIVLGIILIAVAVPGIYSYVYYRRQRKQENNDIVSLTKQYKKTTVLVLCIVAVLLAGIGYLMFSGEVNIEYGENTFTVHSTYWSDVSVDYSQINSVAYKTHGSLSFGSKTMAFNSSKLLLGRFHNEEYGDYQRYSYRNCQAEVIITTKNGEKIILNDIDEQNTEKIYDTLEKKIG